MSILERIVEHKRKEVEEVRKNHPLSSMNVFPEKTSGFRDALAKPGISVIAEFKRKSPSAGFINKHADPVKTAIAYEKNGACAISVLTDSFFFGGNNETLALIRSSVRIPVLRKDFIIDSYQIYEARHIGADAILLIAAVLEKAELQEFIGLARSMGLDCLVEVRSSAELETALDSGADIIGVNNRNLADFSVSLDTSEKIAGLMPETVIRVSESGIHTRDDVTRLEKAGFNAILVGESLMRAENTGVYLKYLMGDG